MNSNNFPKYFLFQILPQYAGGKQRTVYLLAYVYVSARYCHGPAIHVFVNTTLHSYVDRQTNSNSGAGDQARECGSLFALWQHLNKQFLGTIVSSFTRITFILKRLRYGTLSFEAR